MKIKKIFTFILLLFTVFSTLLFINPNVKAEESDPLQGTWIFNDTLTFTSNSYSVNINFVSNDYNYNKILVAGLNAAVSEYLYYRSTTGQDIVYDGRSWFNELYKTIDIISTYDEVVSLNNETKALDILTFLQTNATKHVETYTISGQYQFNDEVTWVYDTSEQEGLLRITFYKYVPNDSARKYYNYMLDDLRESLGNTRYFMFANDIGIGTVQFQGVYVGTFTSNTNINMFADERIIYFSEQEVSKGVYNWLISNGQFINDPTLDPNNPENPDSNNNPNNPNNPNFGTDTVRQIVNQVNAFLRIQILPGLSFNDILLICIALPLLMYILKLFLGG